MRNISISITITHSLPTTNQADELRRKREAQLRQFVFFQLRVHLKSGCDLVAMDKNGKCQVTTVTSDPPLSTLLSGTLSCVAHVMSTLSFPLCLSTGLSDPYVKFKVGGRLLHKSRTIHRDLNPVWDEVFIVPVEDPFQPIIVKVSIGGDVVRVAFERAWGAPC